MNKYKEFTRQELYDLVWATPMVKLAVFGLAQRTPPTTALHLHELLSGFCRINYDGTGSLLLRMGIGRS